MLRKHILHVDLHNHCFGSIDRSCCLFLFLLLLDLSLDTTGTSKIMRWSWMKSFYFLAKNQVSFTYISPVCFNLTVPSASSFCGRKTTKKKNVFILSKPTFVPSTWKVTRYSNLWQGHDKESYLSVSYTRSKSKIVHANSRPGTLYCCFSFGGYGTYQNATIDPPKTIKAAQGPVPGRKYGDH